MNKDTLEKMAVTAFANTQAARDALFSAAEKAIYAAMNLETEKASATTAGKFDGKNAETREAQAREFLSEQYLALAVAQNNERSARHTFDKASIEADTVKTLLQIAELP